MKASLLILLFSCFKLVSAQCELTVEVSQESDCNTLILHAGNYPENAILHWFINEEPYSTGNSVTFELNNGSYQICALYETQDCPQEVTWCETFVINCEGECTESLITLGIDSYMNNGGVSFAAWSLVDEYGMSVASGMAQFSPMDPFYDETLCVPAGCYVLVIQHNGMVLNPENFNVFVGFNGQVLPYEVGYETGLVLTTPFGINADCGWQGECSDNLWASQTGENCLHWSFELGSFQPGETAVWTFGDGTVVNGGHFVAHEFDEPGVYEVCVYFTSELCPGIEVCTEIVVEDCQVQNCELDVEIVQQDCGLFIMSAFNVPENAQVHWTLNGDQFNVGNITTFMLEDGVHEICAMYETPECPEGVFWCETFEVNCNQECIELSMIVVSNVMQNAPVQVIWSIVDENMMSVENGVLQFNTDIQTQGISRCLEPGCYTIMLQYAGEVNPMNFSTTVFISGEPVGVEIEQGNGYMFLGPIGLGVDCENNGNCPDDLYAAQGEDCLHWIFEIGGFQQGESAVWNFGDGQVVEGGHFITHTFENPGVYEVCVSFSSDLCDGIEVCTVITVGADCFSECELDVIIASYTCDMLVMQAIQMPPGAVIHWSLDGEFYSEGAPVTFLIDDGVHEICAMYETPDCPEGVFWCETFEFGCEEECTNTIISIDSFVADGGPGLIAWNLIDENNMSVEAGVTEYSQNDPYFDMLTCLEDGCYTLVLQTNGFFNLEAINFGVYINGISLELNVEYLPGSVVIGPFGINTDCTENGMCDAFFSYENPEGNFFTFSNLSEPAEGAEYLWSFGDGSSSDAENPTHIFTENGEYIVCLTVFSGDCEDTYCQTIVIGQEECTDFTITIASEDIALGVLYWDLVSDEFDLNGEIPLELIPEDGLSLVFCVPNGCYSFEFTWNGMESIIWEMILNQLQSQFGESVDMIISENSVLIEFGVGLDCVDGIVRNNYNNLLVFPVPAQNSLNISLSDTEKQSVVNILDLSGKTVLIDVVKAGYNTIDISALAPGLYNLNIINTDGIQTRRISVIR